ncbi:MAG: DUF2878 domain-containing protein [Pseudomonadota bacterium]
MNNTRLLNGVNIFNAIGFQVGWFVCVTTSSLLGLIFTSIFITFHLYLIRRYAKEFFLKKEICWILIIFIIGFLIEMLFFSLGILYEDIQNPYFTYFITSPLWIICLWLLFATALRTSLAFLFNRPWLAYLATAIMAPWSYFAGSHLNTQVHINKPILLSLAIISIVWVFALWIITYIKHFYFEDIFYDN